MSVVKSVVRLCWVAVCFSCPPILGQDYGDPTSEELYFGLANTAAMLEASDDEMALPEDVDPGWWQPLIGRSLRHDSHDVCLKLDEVLYMALASSEQIKVFQKLPSIRRTANVEADSAFDWYGFLDTQWDRTSDPTGSTLTAGPGISRFRDNNMSMNGGFRKRTTTGGQLEVAQRFGWQDNNSTFFVPGQQGTSRLTVGISQPLLRGRGVEYNQSLVVLANIDHQVAFDELSRQVEGHLLEVARAYWTLYLERGVCFQKLRSYQRAKEVVDRLTLRKSIDVSGAQLKAAKAALADRISDLQRSFTAIKNGESRLRSLVNNPAFGKYSECELLPVDAPAFDLFDVDLHTEVAEGIHNRPEITQAVRQIRAAAIRCGMSRNELLPVLNLVTEAYVAGLADDFDSGQSWTRQFSQGEPGYSIGLNFEIPLGNRAAKARYDRRAIELSQVQHKYQVTLETVRLEVQVAVREIETSQRELFTKQQVVQAREEQLDYQLKRWERLPNEGVTSSLMLENILNAQDQLANAEFEYLKAQITYNLALINLRRTTGTLVQQQVINLPATGQSVDSTQAIPASEIPPIAPIHVDE